MTRELLIYEESCVIAWGLLIMSPDVKIWPTQYCDTTYQNVNLTTALDMI